MGDSVKHILVLCTGNSCRSQMMEGWLAHYGGSSVDVKSAGIETHGVNPKAVQVMAEADVDISHHSSNHIDEYLHYHFDLVITVCDHARESCPVFPSSSRQLHHSFKDPAKTEGSDEEIMESFRSVRDEIRDYSKEVLSSLIS